MHTCCGGFVGITRVMCGVAHYGFSSFGLFARYFTPVLTVVDGSFASRNLFEVSLCSAVFSGRTFFRWSLPLPSRWWTAVFCTLGLTSWVCFQSRLLSLRSRYALSMPFERDSTRLHCSRAQTVIVEVVLHLAPFVKVFEEL